MSHFRSSSLAVTQDSLYGFTFGGQVSFRASAFGTNVQAGQILTNSDYLYFGDGGGTTIYFRVLSVSNDVLIGSIVNAAGNAITHTYASARQDYEAYFQGNARVTTSDAFSNGGYRSEVTVNAGIVNHAPVTATPAVVQVADNTLFTYQLSASDADGNPLTYSLGRANDFISSSASASTIVAPAGLTLSAGGLLTWDVRDMGGAAVSAGQFYTVSVKISDGLTATPVDFLLSIVSTATNQAPIFTSVPQGNQIATVGVENEIELRATDPNGNLQSIIALNPPAGLTTEYHGGEGELHVNFTPAAPGTYVVNFQATDSGGLTTQASVTYVVPSTTIAIVGPAAQIEGDSGTSFFNFVVTRSDTSGSPLAIYTVTNGTTDAADFGTGFVSTGTVAFGAGQTTAVIAVPVRGDTTVEQTETFTVTLSNPQGAAISGPAAAVGTIINDDVDTVSPRYLVSNGIGATGLVGASGNDVYVVSNPLTTIVDGPNGGTDTVYVSTEFGLTTYALNGGAFIETISAQEQQGTSALNLTGNFYTQTLIGNNGVNILNGNGGADTLIGLGGDDTYAIADASAVIVEQPGQGYDRVYTSVGYTLTGTASVEELGFTNQGGTENLNLIGNAFDQKIVGNYGDNVLNGNGGVDTLIGLLGNDTYVVGDSRTVVIENAGEGFDTVFANTSYTLAAGSSIELLSTATQGGTEAYDLTGNGFAQAVIGNNGVNVIDGGAGADTLTGLGGADTFRFSTALGNGNVDAITDFGNGADRISLASGIFTGMAQGTLSASNFVNGTAATTADQYIVYNQTTGQLFFDADGSGAGAAVLFATVAPNTIITANMITVV